MKIDESYDGPTVVVLVEETSASWRVVSAHLDRDDAALSLAREILRVGGARASDWSVVTVPAPVLADAPAEPRRGTGGGALGPQLWAALEPLGIADDADEDHMIGRVRDLVGEVLDGDAVPDPAGDQRAAPDERDADLAVALGWSESDVQGVDGSWARMLAEVCRLAGTGQYASDPTEPMLNGLEAAYRAQAVATSTTPWEDMDGRQQRGIVTLVDGIVRAYLAGLADDDSAA